MLDSSVMSGMYKPLQVEGGWLVFFCEEGKPPRLADGQKRPYAQRTNAYRRARKLNQALEEVERMIKRDGAIII